MAVSFGRDHPTEECLRILAVHISSSDLVTQRAAVLESELALEVDFDQGSAVGLLCFVELIPAIPPSPLTVIELIKGLAKNICYALAPRASRLNSAQTAFNSPSIGVGKLMRVEVLVPLLGGVLADPS
jgi:hypothetical protein